MNRKFRVFVTTLALAVSGCASIFRMPPLPPDMPERALVRDLARIADAREQLGWFIDELEVNEAMEDVLKTVCRVEDSGRRRAMGWLGAEILRQGGPIEQAFVDNGNSLDSLETLLLLSRTQGLLNAAEFRVRRGDCPFWLPREPDFREVQGEFRKWILSVEGGGRFYGGLEAGEPGYGGGGAGRGLIGYGIRDRLSVLGAIEGGGVARISGLLNDSSDESTIIIVGAMPVVVRYYYLAEYLEAELGPMGFYYQSSNEFQWGIRSGFSIGLTQKRIKGVAPGLALSIVYDMAPPGNGREWMHQISAGLKAAFSLGLYRDAAM